MRARARMCIERDKNRARRIAGRKEKKMTYQHICCYPLINDVDPDKVDTLVQSILSNGWQGPPILVYGDTLLTGSHRLAALHKIANNPDTCGAGVLWEDIAEDVTDIVNAAIMRKAEELGIEPWDVDLDYSDIGWILDGTEYERYKDDTREW